MRWEQTDGVQDSRKNALKNVGNKFTSEEKNNFLTLANSEPYRDLPPCKIIPLLADQGEYYGSESTLYRILRELKQLRHRQLSRPSTHRRPQAYEASGPKQLWSWDITYLPTAVRGLYFYLYLIMDVYSRKIVGWSIHEEQNSDYSSKVMAQACQDEHITPQQLVLHSDNGAPMKGATMLAMLEKLGVIPSFSRPSVSDDNPYSEALFRTLKYHPSFLLTERFANLQEARAWTETFVVWYNDRHIHSGLKFVTPNQRHAGDDQAILAHRKQVYQTAQKKHPGRWSKGVRNWSLPTTVSLNPDRKSRHQHSDKKTISNA